MELAKNEITAVREVANLVQEHVVELTDFELLLVGGGTGDIHLG